MNPLRYILLCTAIALSCSPLLTAQAPSQLWSKTYGGPFWEKGYGGTPTDDDGFVVVGYTESFGNGESDLYLMRVDRNGDTLWTRTYGGPGWEEGYAIAQTEEDKGFIVVGQTVPEEDASTRAWMLRTDMNGDTLWTYTWGDTEWRYNVNDVRETPDGNFVVVGYAASSIPGSGNGWISMVDRNGTLLWSKVLEAQYTAIFSSVDFTEDNGLVVAGTIRTGNGFDGWILRMRNNGDTIVTRTFGNDDGDVFAAVRRTSRGSFICVGATDSYGAGKLDILVAEYSSDLAEVEMKTYGGAEHDYGNGLILTPDGGYAIVGLTEAAGSNNPEALVVRVDGSGNLKWEERYGMPGIDEATGIFGTEEGGYWIVGSFAETENSSSDIRLMRLAADPVSSVAEAAPTTGGIRIEEPAPNPFERSTAIQWQLEATAHVQITVQDLRGRTVHVLVDEQRSPGTYSTEWNGRNTQAILMPSGTYLCTVTVDGQLHTSKKIVLNK